MFRKYAILLCVAVATAASAAPAGAVNRPGPWRSGEVNCYTMNSDFFWARVTATAPFMSAPFAETSWFGPDGTMYTSAEQDIAYRAHLQKYIGGAWRTAPSGEVRVLWTDHRYYNASYGPWYYGRVTGGGFEREKPIRETTFFEVFNRGAYRILYEMYWYPVRWSPWSGYAWGRGLHESGYAGANGEYCNWPEIRIP
jgi:hypothetical protein